MEGGAKHVEGLMVGFDILMSNGDLKQIQLLRHDGIARSNTQLRGKVITVPRHFAEKWSLEHAQLTTPHVGCPNTHLYTRTQDPFKS